MSPVRAAAVRFKLRGVHHRELKTLAERELASDSASSVRHLLRGLSPDEQ